MSKEWKLPYVRSRGQFDSLLWALVDCGLVSIRGCGRVSNRERPITINAQLEDVKHALKSNAPMQQVLCGKSTRMHGANMYSKK